MTAKWYYSVGGQQVGPTTVDEIRAGMAAGKIGHNDQVWTHGMPQWVAASTLPEFAGASMGAGPTLAAPAVPATLNYVTPMSRSLSDVRATSTSLLMLRQTKPWVRFLSIMMLIGAGIMVVGGVVIMVMSSQVSSSAGSWTGETQAVVMIGLSAVYGVPAWFLSQYAASIGKLNQSQHERDLEEALRWQKSFWKFMGIVTMIILIVYGVIVLVAVTAGGAWRAFR